MKFSFGICTGGDADHLINKIIDSIEAQQISEYEIIIVGNSKVNRQNTAIINFDENIKPKWITRKKNIITEQAKYDNIVYLHDYIILTDSWYDGWLKFGSNYKAAMNIVLNYDSSRYRDWILAPWCKNTKAYKEGTGLEYEHNLLPYEADGSLFSQIMYFSGSYFVVKKDVMLEFPLDENLVWGHGEDTQWSHRVRSKYHFDLNVESTVRIISPGKNIQYFFEMPKAGYEKLKQNLETKFFSDMCEFCK